MISVCKEPDGFSRIGELIEAKSTRGALRNLQDAQESTDHSYNEDHEAQPSTIVVAKQNHADENRKRWEER